MKALKIGGSVITNKFGYKEPNKKEIKRISKELSKKYKDLILIHGAGSFGHPLVKENNLHKEIETKKQKNSLIKVQNSVKELNKLITNQLSKQNIPTMSIHPSSSFITEEGEIKSSGGIETIKEALKQDILPVLHGDIVLDKETTANVLSGDKIITYLSKEIPIQTIGVGARSSVLDENKEPLKEINEFNSNLFRETKSVDVTGGMSYKVKKLLETKKTSFIFDATQKGSIQRFIEGKKLGTEVFYDEY